MRGKWKEGREEKRVKKKKKKNRRQAIKGLAISRSLPLFFFLFFFRGISGLTIQ